MIQGLGRRRAEEFEAALAGDAARIRPEIAALVAVTERVSTVSVPQMRSEFRSSLRADLMAEATTALAVPSDTTDAATPAPPSFAGTTVPAWRRRTASAVTGALVIGGSGLGVGFASQSALPGEVLYPVKQTLETIEVGLAGSPAATGSEQLERARTRLAEVRELVLTKGDEPQTAGLVRDTLRAFEIQAKQAGSSMATAYTEDADAQAVAELRAFASEGLADLTELSGIVSSDNAVDVRQAARTLAELDAQAQQLCPGCSSLGPLTLPPVLAALSLPENVPTPDIGVPTPPRLTDAGPAPGDAPIRQDRPGEIDATEILPTDAPGDRDPGRPGPRQGEDPRNDNGDGPATQPRDERPGDQGTGDGPVDLPSLDPPSVDLPSIDLPADDPTVRMPDLPGATLDPDLPGTGLPSVPEATLPGATIPDITVTAATGLVGDVVDDATEGLDPGDGLDNPLD